MNGLCGNNDIILEIDKLSKGFSGAKQAEVIALDDVTLNLYSGECLGIVGESGCGKSTLARILVGIEKPDSGTIRFKGKEIAGIEGKALRDYRRNIQMVFQNPIDVFSPRMKIGKFLCEGLLNYNILNRREARQEAKHLMEMVGLGESFLSRLPHQLSGGQLQRVVIARCVSIKPEVIIWDEATSALDVSIQKKILRLIVSLQEDYGLSYIFIGHDISVVRSVSHRIAVIYRGKVVEVIESEYLKEQAIHPYTRDLLNSVFSINDTKHNKKISLVQDGIFNDGPKDACIYASRCSICDDICINKEPRLRFVDGRHSVACHMASSPPDSRQSYSHQETETNVYRKT